jgi:ribosomal-protein-alanine N-acetyltransferase
MKLEYHKDNLILKVLNESNTMEVLDFYYRNRECFDKYEADKPDTFYTPEYIRNVMQAEYNGHIHGKYTRFFLYDRTIPNTIIGTVSFSNIHTGALMSCCIGYKIDTQFQSSGYGRRMLTMALKIMVTERGMHRIEAYIEPDNDISLKLVKSLGFISEGMAYSYVLMNGQWRDHLRYTYIS